MTAQTEHSLSQVWQLEVGQNPTSFEHEPVERTLAKCQRYYLKSTNTAVTSYPSSGGYANGMYLFPVQMRADPTGSYTDVSGNGSGLAYANNVDGFFATYQSLVASSAGGFSFTQDAEL